MRNNEMLKLSIPYLITLVITLLVFWSYSGIVEWTHALFLVSGVFLTLLALIVVAAVGVTPVSTDIRFGSLLTQAGLGNLILGMPLFLRGPPPLLFVAPAIPTLIVAVTAEEAYRISSALAFSLTGIPVAAVVASALVFGGMHYYWVRPGQWLFAVAGGIVLSTLLVLFKSPLACVITHLMYDLAAFQYIPPLTLLLSSILLMAVGLIILMKQGEFKLWS